MHDTVTIPIQNDLQVSFKTPNALAGGSVLPLVKIVTSTAARIAVPVALPKSNVTGIAPSPGCTSNLMLVNANAAPSANKPLKNGMLHKITATLSKINGIHAFTISPNECAALLLSSSGTMRKILDGFHFIHSKASATKAKSGGRMSTNSGPTK